MEVFFWTTSRRRSLGIVMSVSTLARELVGGLLGDELAALAFEGERLGHDTDGERAELLGDLGHDGRGSGARCRRRDPR